MPTPRESGSKAPLTRADLHVHTRASSRGATRWLDALGIAESYSEPERVYDLARARGMDLVAITDHDTIAGAMELVERGLPGVIAGEEITTRLPDTGQVLHVLVWMLTPAQHDAVGRLGLRRDAVALAHWIRENHLPHALAHPLFDLSGGLDRATLERCTLLFGGFEAINGGHTTAAHRVAFGRFLRATDSVRIAEPATELREPRLWPNSWLTAGSDDHALFNLARAWTAAPGAHTPDSFFRTIMRGGGIVGGRDATTRSLAHQFLGVAGRCAGATTDSAALGAARRALNALPAMRAVLGVAASPTDDPDADAERIDAVVCRAATESFSRLAARARADPAALGSLVLTQAAEVCAVTQHLKEHALLRDLRAERESRRSEMGAAPPRPICLFVDALDHTSGVSRFVQDLARRAEASGRPLAVFTCATGRREWPTNVRAVEPLGSIPTPGYPGLWLAVPRIAALIERVAGLDPWAVHVSTPGPVGLAGVLAARALGVPLVATHHTDLPAYARWLLGSGAGGAIAAWVLRALYARCARVAARSSVSARSIEQLGVGADRVRIITPGVDLSRFSPTRRDPAVWEGFTSVDRSSVKALYVGRISVEKNLPMLAEVWRSAQTRLARAGVNAELIVVGDGPWAGAMQQALRGARARFLGEIRDERLCAIYATCDCFVFPSTTETLGQVVIEAQASGLPALVSTSGGPAEIIADGRTGFVRDAAQTDAWVRATVALASDRESRARMGRAAAVRAARFSFGRSFESFWAIHEEVVGPRVHRALRAAAVCS